MMVRSLILAAALALCAGPAVGASQLTGQCMWDNLPTGRREALLAGYQAKGFSSASITVDDTDLRKSLRACGVTDANAVDAGRLVVAQLLEKGTVLVLEKRYGVSPDVMLATWSALDEATRGQLVVLADKVFDGKAGDPERETMRLIVEPIMDRLNLEDRDASVQIGAYLLGRTLRAEVEAP